MTRICGLAAIIAIAVCACVDGATMPSIRGTVYQDLDTNMAPSPGEGVAGAVIRLFQDDGDGTFEPGADDSQVGSDFTTGVDGMYLFDALSAFAGYFVQRPAQTIGSLNLPEDVSGLIQPGTPSLVIDDFLATQITAASSMTPVMTSAITDAAALGGERDIYAELLSGVGEVEIRVNAFGMNVLQYDTTAGVRGRGIVTWDGVDGSANATPSLGLSGVDLTEGGKNTDLILKLGVDAAGAGETATVKLYQGSADNVSEATVAIPVTDGMATGSAFLPFSSFTGSVSPAMVDAIQLQLGGGARSIDAQVAIFGAIGPKEHDFAVIPEPSGLLGALIAFGWIVLGHRRNRPLI